MRPVRSSAVLVLSLSLAVGVSACGGGSSSSGSNASGGAQSTVNGATFTLAASQDPGSLDPQMSAVSTLIQLDAFAYDALVGIDAKTGDPQPELASSWKVSPTKASFAIKSGVTCSDGAPFTAQTVVNNIKFVEDPANKSPLLGAFVPSGVTATASGSTVDLKLSAPSPFLLSSLSNLPMVCDKGLKNRGSLKSTTDGTGPYALSQATPNNQYVYTLRSGYTWGPNGTTTAQAGMPAKLVVKIVPNETTAANELLAGQLNAASIIGADRTRLKAAGLPSVDTTLITGEQWYNQAAGHVTSDPKVRLALTQALDLSQLEKVITSNLGGPATQLAVVEPAGCQGNSVSGNVPAFDTSAAKATLASDGWTAGSDGVLTKGGKKLALSMIYDTSLGNGGDAAAELAVQQWKAIGVDVTTKAQTETAMSNALFGTGSWDIAWEPLNVNTPDQLIPFLSGTAAPKGTNFAAINNPTYTSTATAALKKSGSSGCTDWHSAEAALFKDADVVPFANSLIPTFVKGATFESAGVIQPMTIKMLG